MAFERNGEFVTRGSQPTLCHRKPVGLSYLGRRQRSRHVLSTGITRGSGELRLLQSVPSSSRSASTSTASSTPGLADVPKRLHLFDINYSLYCSSQGFAKQDCHCYLHLGWLHVSCLRDRERAQRLARPAAHSAARQERQRGREATGAELRAHVERHGQGVHSWREQLHPGGPPERPATSLRDPKLCEVLPGRLRPLCRVPPRVFALLCPQWPALQTRDRSQFSLRLRSAPHRLWPSWGVSVPPPDDGQGDGELEEQGALPEILWFPKSLLIAERGATSRRKSNAAPEERSAKHGTQPDDLGTSVGGRRQAWSGDSWARDEATKTALREVISDPTFCSSEWTEMNYELLKVRLLLHLTKHKPPLSNFSCWVCISWALQVFWNFISWYNPLSKEPLLIFTTTKLQRWDRQLKLNQRPLPWQRRARAQQLELLPARRHSWGELGRDLHRVQPQSWGWELFVKYCKPDFAKMSTSPSAPPSEASQPLRLLIWRLHGHGRPPSETFKCCPAPTKTE